MDSPAVYVTDEFVVAGGTAGGGWSRDQLALLGVPWPPRAGSKVAVVGRQLSARDAGCFCR